MTVELWQPLDVEGLKTSSERQFALEIGVLRALGAYPGANQEQINLITGEPLGDRFDNIGIHCVTVGGIAHAIARRVRPDDPTWALRVGGKGTLHDANKPLEAMDRDAWIRERFRINPYAPESYAWRYHQVMRPLLEHRGISADIVAYMEHAGKETGHTSFLYAGRIVGSKWVLNTDDLDGLIVATVDNKVHSPLPGSAETATFLVPVAERQRRSQFDTRYWFMNVEGFGYDHGGKPQLICFADKHPECAMFLVSRDWEQWFAEKQARGESGIFVTYQEYVRDQLRTDHPELVFVDTYMQWQRTIDRAISAHLLSLISSESTDDPESALIALVSS